jgi:hypothetical protein
MKSNVSHSELGKYRNALMKLLNVVQVKDLQGTLAEEVKTIYKLIEFIDSNTQSK